MIRRPSGLRRLQKKASGILRGSFSSSKKAASPSESRDATPSKQRRGANFDAAAASASSDGGASDTSDAPFEYPMPPSVRKMNRKSSESRMSAHSSSILIGEGRHAARRHA